MPQPSALREGEPKHLLPGTFVPSARHTLHGVRSVRRAIFGPDESLFVADRDAGSIKRFDGATGAFQREYRHHHLTTPVHLAFRPGDGALLAGSRDGNAVFAIDTVTGDVSRLVESGAGGLRAPGGLAFGQDGKLYVSSRETRQILRFDAETGAPDTEPFLDGLGTIPSSLTGGRVRVPVMMVGEGRHASPRSVHERGAYMMTATPISAIAPPTTS